MTLYVHDIYVLLLGYNFFATIHEKKSHFIFKLVPWL